MKIGIDCRLFSSSFTGIGRCTHELVKHIIEMNRKLAEPHELVLFFNNPEYREFRSLAPIKKVLINAKHYSFDEQWTFWRKLKKEKCDVVHFPHFNKPILYKGDYTVTIHDLTLSMFPGKKMTKWYHRLAYHMVIKSAIKHARRVIAVSQNTKNDIIEHFKIKPDKIAVVYNGVNKEFDLMKDVEKTHPTLRKHKINKQFLLYVGVWRSHKNLPRMIEAFKKLRESSDIQLVITGKPDLHYPEVIDTVKRLKLTENVIFPGLVSEKELIHLYNAAMIFIFPSLYEGFGLPPLESMRCGTPVVASRTSSIPEICGNENAIFFDPYDVEDIAEKIAMVYKDAELQGRLIKNGAERASEFSWEKMSKDTFKIIQNV